MASRSHFTRSGRNGQRLVHSADLCSRALFLQERGKRLGCDHTRLAKLAPELLDVADRHPVVRRRLSFRLRLHAALRYRNAEWRTVSCRAAARRALQWACVADRRRARHRSKLPDVPGDRASVALCLVALSCQPAASTLSTRRPGDADERGKPISKDVLPIELG